MDILAESHWAWTRPLKSMPSRRYELLLFLVLWIGFGSTYFIKKPLGVIKSDMKTDLDLTKFQLGGLDTALLFPYAAAQVLLAPLADRLGTRMTLTICYVIAALSMIAFGLLADSYQLCMIQLAICGTALATTWPACSKALTSHFSRSKQIDGIFGLFSTSASVGGVLGTFMAVWCLDIYGWRFVYVMPCLFILLMASITHLIVRSPEELDRSTDELQLIQLPNQSWISLWSLPMIKEIIISVFTLKLVRYCMYMWLPMYLTDHLGYDRVTSGLMSTAFEVGGGLGSASIGFLSNTNNSQMKTLSFLTALSSVCLLVFALTASLGPFMNVTFLFLAGAANAAPDTLLSGSIPCQLGERNGMASGAALTGSFINNFIITHFF